MHATRLCKTIGIGVAVFGPILAGLIQTKFLPPFLPSTLLFIAIILAFLLVAIARLHEAYTAYIQSSLPRTTYALLAGSWLVGYLGCAIYILWITAVTLSFIDSSTMQSVVPVSVLFALLGYGLFTNTKHRYHTSNTAHNELY